MAERGGVRGHDARLTGVKGTRAPARVAGAIISTMARRVLFLLVAALLLRGWVGAALAGDMAAQDLQAVIAQVTVQQGHDCAHVATDEASDDAAVSPLHAHCQGCTLHAPRDGVVGGCLGGRQGSAEEGVSREYATPGPA